MNNPTLIDRLTGQLPGKTEGLSIITIVMSLVFAILHQFFGVNLSVETLTSISGLVVGLLGVALGSRTARTEATVNQVQAAQTEAVPPKEPKT